MLADTRDGEEGDVAVYQRRGLHGEVVHELAQRILSGRYPEGVALDLAEIEAEFGVSRTVVRESLKVLAAKGLVDARQKRGTFVCERSTWNLLDGDMIRWQLMDEDNVSFLDDLAEVRQIIEPAAARLAAERRTDEDVERLERAIEGMAEAYRNGDEENEVAADLAFHRALLRAGHNELLQRMEMVIEAGLERRHQLVHGGPSGDPTDNHLPVLEAIRVQYPAAAEGAMRDLLEVTERDIKALVHRLPE
jgi:GntR family transcriptional regulator, galactonate operon transcriptional repressor